MIKPGLQYLIDSPHTQNRSVITCLGYVPGVGLEENEYRYRLEGSWNGYEFWFLSLSHEYAEKHLLPLTEIGKLLYDR